MTLMNDTVNYAPIEAIYIKKSNITNTLFKEALHYLLIFVIIYLFTSFKSSK